MINFRCAWRTLWLAIFCLGLSFRLDAQDHEFGGSVRGYQFLSFEDSELLQRRDAELWLLRLTQASAFSDVFSLEVHGLLNFASPPAVSESGIAVSNTFRFFPLDVEIYSGEHVLSQASFDRLNFKLEFDDVEVTAGRQAVTWGVSYFWPAMDLFAPFNPQQVDRDYKAGVDAVRVVIPLGNFSEMEVLGGVLGPSFDRDGSAAALLRWNVGSADLGFMGGHFHGDNVLGSFLTANLRGTGLRGEITWTDSGDPDDVERSRETFWRGSAGIDRQLVPSLTLSMEIAYNGYGSRDAADYLELLQADRILRGEVTGLGKAYAGVSTIWLLHPLWTLTNTALINWNDPSGMWIPTLNWSSSDNSEVIFGGQLGLGAGLTRDGRLGSEYGIIPASFFASLRLYF
jgi:hypothetical protein